MTKPTPRIAAARVALLEAVAVAAQAYLVSVEQQAACIYDLDHETPGYLASEEYATLETALELAGYAVPAAPEEEALPEIYYFSDKTGAVLCNACWCASPPVSLPPRWHRVEVAHASTSEVPVCSVCHRPVIVKKRGSIA